MKSTFSHLFTFKPILISLFMIGLCVVATPSIQAQSSLVNDNFATVPPGSYVSPATAIVRLEEQCTTLKAQLEIYNSSSQEYKNALAKYEFFNSMLTALYDGKTTEQALGIGLGVLATDAVGNLSKQKRQEYKEEAIELLSA